MSFNLTVGNPLAHRIRVYYEGSDTITEGMALCYNQDTTTNWFGGSVALSTGVVTQTSTTAEGSQNEGKYIRVEKPATANLGWFAGVVAKGGWVGQAGPRALDVYVPNGAIVPVRSYVSSTAASNALAIMNGQYYLGNPTAGMGDGGARYVAVAMETVDRSSTAGLCLAKLDPNMFLSQSYGATKLIFATGGTVQTICNFINADSNQTSGEFVALFVRSNVDTAGSGDTGYAVYGEGNVNAVAAGSYCVGNRFALNLWGGTQTASVIAGLCAEIFESGANLTGSTTIAPLWLRTQIEATNPPAANTHYMIYINVDGADKPDGLLKAESLNAIGALASITNAPALATGDVMIPVRLAGTTYYIPAMADSGQ